MDKQKQIDELKELRETIHKVCYSAEDCEGYCHLCLSEGLYNEGYRKIPEGAVVLTREEYDELQVGKDFNYGYHSGEINMTAYYENIRLPEVRKETAEKFAEMAKERIYSHDYLLQDTDDLLVQEIYEICEKITEDKV